MKLIQQSKLFFKEGNSDKVYEIDLCELSPGEYLVNFRYGKRGGTLKEGTKTPAAIPREQAGILFAELENEKRKKGYQTETEMFVELPSLEAVAPASAEGAILQRLQDAVTGKNSFKTVWKTSRVIWKAGQLQITEAIPFIIKLATRGDEMQAYSALWALIQLKAQQAVPVFDALATNIRQKVYIRNLAWEGLLTVTTAAEQTQVGVRLLAQLPEEVRYAIETNAPALLTAALTKHTGEGRVDYVSTLYLLCKIYTWILPVLAETLKGWAFRPPYFRQIRALYKLAQVRKDAAVIAALSYRFEKEPAMFKRTTALDGSYKQHLAVIGQAVRVGAELKSNESKLAFSQFTKEYFQKNAVSFLQHTGKDSDAAAYLKLAVATLLQYAETDYTKAEERPLSPYGQYNFQTRIYTFTLFNYPECSESLLLSTILFGNDTARKLQPNLRFITGKRDVTSTRYYYSPNDVTPVEAPGAGKAADAPAPDSSPGSVINTAVNALRNLFGKKAETPPKEEKPVLSAMKVPEEISAITRLELYPEHWDAIPEAYVQLLMQARMQIIHRFAYGNLKAHADFEKIASRFDGKAILQLLNSSFEIPNLLGFEVLEKRAAEFYSQPEFMGHVLNGNSPQARAWAQAWVEKDAAVYFNDLEFTLLLLFNSREENNQWIDTLLQKTPFTEDRLRVVLGKAITGLLHFENTAGNNSLAKRVIDRLDTIAAAYLEQISWSIVEQLISSPLETNKILAGKILISKSRHVAPTEIPISLTELFLQHEAPEVRQNGIWLLEQYPDDFLGGHIRFVLNQCDSMYPDVVTAALTCIGRLIKHNPQVGDTAVRYLVYVLIRKERFEGAHTQIGNFVAGELKPYCNSGLRPQDITKLIHAHYRASQLAGYDMLKAYDKPGEFSLGQIISFGAHEILAIRQWCWNYFTENVPRIRYEKEKALSLLDSRWDDTRTYAFHFFRTVFTGADWDTDTLVGIVDSIRPDVESFGKELITRYFKPEHAMEYLTKLSEHPGVQVQAFVTNYLSLYAADNPALLQQLEFYFRSVLTRVNKARVAKDRIFSFLHREALKSAAAAAWIVPVIDDVSAQATIGDKATCIRILAEIKNHYPHLDMHLVIKN